MISRLSTVFIYKPVFLETHLKALLRGCATILQSCKSWSDMEVNSFERLPLLTSDMLWHPVDANWLNTTPEEELWVCQKSRQLLIWMKIYSLKWQDGKSAGYCRKVNDMDVKTWNRLRTDLVLSEFYVWDHEYLF